MPRMVKCPLSILRIRRDDLPVRSAHSPSSENIHKPSQEDCHAAQLGPDRSGEVTLGSRVNFRLHRKPVWQIADAVSTLREGYG